MSEDALPSRVRAWRDAGELVEFGGHRIHLSSRPGKSPLLVFLHGFPTSSYDWRLLVERFDDHAALLPDFLGFGLSDKPADHVYDLHWQADLVEDLVARFGEGMPVYLIAHDMGTSVANELMARDTDGSFEMELAGVFLFNGSMLQHLAEPTIAQKLLRGPLGPVMAKLTSERFFRQQFGSIFSPDHPLSDDEAEDQWALITHNGGHRLGHRLIRYMDERMRWAERWHGALQDWPGPLSLAWGMLDPVARPEVLAGILALRPAAPIERFSDLGHYPQLEDPDRLGRAIESALYSSTLPGPSA